MKICDLLFVLHWCSHSTPNSMLQFFRRSVRCRLASSRTALNCSCLSIQINALWQQSLLAPFASILYLCVLGSSSKILDKWTFHFKRVALGDVQGLQGMYSCTSYLWLQHLALAKGGPFWIAALVGGERTKTEWCWAECKIQLAEYYAQVLDVMIVFDLRCSFLLAQILAM